MKIRIDLENIIKEKNVSKNSICLNCKMQRTQLNNYCKSKITKVDLQVLARLCAYLECTPNDILNLEE